MLEPIAFDCYIEGGIFKRVEEPVIALLNPVKIDSLYKEELILFQAFTDSIFNNYYLHFLKKYSDEKYIENIIETLQPVCDSLSVPLQAEFPYYQFDFDYLREQAQLINENLENIKNNILKLDKAVRKINRNKFLKMPEVEINPDLTPYLIHAFYNKNSGSIDVLNYIAAEVSVAGVLLTDRMPVSLSSEEAIKPYDGINPQRISIPVNGNPYKLLFTVNDETMEAEISPWPFHKNESTRQQLIKSANYNELTWHEDTVVFEGNYIFTSDVYIPPGKLVMMKPGTQINLTNGAGFFSFSTVYAKGTDNNQIEIFSEDKKSQGFHVFQASNRSVFINTKFYQLGNIRKGGWQTPSAVTFYEADVDFFNCTFSSNIDCDDALNVVRSDFHVEGCTFIDTFADAFDSDFCTGIVINCVFNNIGNDAIDFSGSHVFITGCEMKGINDKAISGGENSKLIVESCTIEKATIGVASKDSSLVQVKKLEMNKVVYGFVSFKKKPEYGPAHLTAENLKMKRVMVFHQIEEGSVFTVNKQPIHGREKRLAIKLYQ